MINERDLVCQVCGGGAALFDVVDFNKSCEETRGRYLSHSGVPIYYALCGNCGFCFAPEMMKWTPEEFGQRVYNARYVEVDPDYVESRPRNNATVLKSFFREKGATIRHLDYGGGNGMLTRLLAEGGWRSTSYDPFLDQGTKIETLGRFDFITAFEVFEHVVDVQQLMTNLKQLVAENGIIMFSTVFTDGNIKKHERLAWWYAAPRNGHISLFSKNSVMLLGQKYGFTYGNFSDTVHAFYTGMPAWAEGVIALNEPATQKSTLNVQ